jgi:hypothetical protein
MASIKGLQLTVTTDRPHDKATITVTCDVEFTEVEVKTMNMLGLRYSLECHLLDMDMLYPDQVVKFDAQELPRASSGVNTQAHAVFETVALMSELHWYIFGKDSLAAELTLTDQETGARDVKRSEVLRVNLAA